MLILKAMEEPRVFKQLPVETRAYSPEDCTFFGHRISRTKQNSVHFKHGGPYGGETWKPLAEK